MYRNKMTSPPNGLIHDSVTPGTSPESYHTPPSSSMYTPVEPTAADMPNDLPPTHTLPPHEIQTHNPATPSLPSHEIPTHNVPPHVPPHEITTEFSSCSDSDLTSTTSSDSCGASNDLPSEQITNIHDSGPESPHNDSCIQYPAAEGIPYSGPNVMHGNQTDVTIHDVNRHSGKVHGTSVHELDMNDNGSHESQDGGQDSNSLQQGRKYIYI